MIKTMSDIILDEKFQNYLYFNLDSNIAEDLRNNLDINRQDVLAVVLKIILNIELSNELQ